MDRTGAGEADHNMTSIEDGDQSNVDQGADDGTQNETDQENGNAESQPGGDALSDGGAADSEAGEDAGAEEVASGSEEGGSGSKLDLSSVKDEILNEVRNLLPKPEPEKPIELTEEQWTQKEAEMGIPRTAIKAFAQQQVYLYRQIEKMIEGRFAGIEKDAAVGSLSKEKGFTDAPRYRKDMDEFLGQFDPRSHKNPELLKAAYFYAKGKASSGQVRKAQKSGELNRRISGTARPASPNAAGRRPAFKPLSAIERDAASRMNMPESEYQKLKSQRGKPIAI